MYMGYFLSNRFPYPQDAAGPFPSYVGAPFLKSHSNSIADARYGLSYYRTNENVQRNYRVRGGMLGALSAVDSPIVLGGFAVAALAWFAFHRKR